MEERLQKILAQAGFGSRRSCEELIVAKRVRVNGQIAELGSKADVMKDTILVDGQAIPKPAAHLYIALNKPRDVLSDVDPNDPRQTVRDLVNVAGHLFSVGRLDFDSEGLILLTNDGELANHLTHPRYGHEKEYMVLVATRPDEEQLEALRRGIVLEDGVRTRPARVTLQSQAGKGAWLKFILKEGRKRQIREMGSRIGLPVSRILRVRIGTLELGELKPGEWRHLTREEIRRLKESVSSERARPASEGPRSERPRRPTSSARTDRPRWTPDGTRDEGSRGASGGRREDAGHENSGAARGGQRRWSPAGKPGDNPRASSAGRRDEQPREAGSDRREERPRRAPDGAPRTSTGGRRTEQPRGPFSGPRNDRPRRTNDNPRGPRPPAARDVENERDGGLRKMKDEIENESAEQPRPRHPSSPRKTR